MPTIRDNEDCNNKRGSDEANLDEIPALIPLNQLPQIDVNGKNISDATAESSVPTDGFKPEWRFYMIFITLSIITLASALDSTSLSVALPIITKRLGGTTIEAFWAGTSFFLTSTVFQPTFVSMSHIFGRKIALDVALILFAIGAILAAVSNNFTLLLIGRSLQGVGGGGIISLSEVLITDLVPLRYRGNWFGYLSGMWAVGSVSGPVIGGAFAENVSWRWIFWINLPIIGVSIVLVTIFVRLAFIPGSLSEKLQRLDWVGSFLFTASTTSFMIPITWGGVSYPWNSWHTLVPLLIGIAGLVSFVFYERFVAVEPMVPLSIFNKWASRTTYFQTVLHGMILWSTLYYLPLYYQAVKGFSPILSGVALFPETFSVAPASVAVGIAVAATGHYRWALWIGWAVTILGTGLLYLMDSNISTAGWILVNLIVGLGTGVLFPAMAFSIQAAVDPGDVAFGVAFYSFFRAFGQSLGVAVGGVIFQNEIRRQILHRPLLSPFAERYGTDATGLVFIIRSMEPSETRDQLIMSYADALKILWVVMCATAVLAGITSIFTKGYSLDQTLETNQGYEQKKKRDATKVYSEGSELGRIMA